MQHNVHPHVPSSTDAAALSVALPNDQCISMLYVTTDRLKKIEDGSIHQKEQAYPWDIFQQPFL